MRRLLAVPLVVLLVHLIVGAALTAADDPKPTKEAGVQTLRDLLGALEAKDYPKAVTYLKLPPSLKQEEAEKLAGKLLENKEISKKGIDVIARDGKWGKFAEVIDAERAKKTAERFGVPPDACWGMSLKNAEVGLYWDGKKFQVIRCNNVGKLE